MESPSDEVDGVSRSPPDDGALREVDGAGQLSPDDGDLREDINDDENISSTDKLEVVTPGESAVDGVTSSTSSRSNQSRQNLVDNMADKINRPHQAETSVHSAESTSADPDTEAIDRPVAMETSCPEAAGSDGSGDATEHAAADSSSVCSDLPGEPDQESQVNEANSSQVLSTQYNESAEGDVGSSNYSHPGEHNIADLENAVGSSECTQENIGTDSAESGIDSSHRIELENNTMLDSTESSVGSSDHETQEITDSIENRVGSSEGMQSPERNISNYLVESGVGSSARSHPEDNAITDSVEEGVGSSAHSHPEGDAITDSVEEGVGSSDRDHTMETEDLPESSVGSSDHIQPEDNTVSHTSDSVENIVESSDLTHPEESSRENLEMDDSETMADSPCGLSQIRITCVQSMAADSLEMEVEEGVQYSSEDRQDEDTCPVTSQRSEVNFQATSSDREVSTMAMTPDPELSTSHTNNIEVCTSTSSTAMSDISSSINSDISSSEVVPSQSNVNMSSQFYTLTSGEGNDSEMSSVCQSSMEPSTVTSQSGETVPQITTSSVLSSTSMTSKEGNEGHPSQNSEASLSRQVGDLGDCPHDVEATTSSSVSTVVSSTQEVVKSVIVGATSDNAHSAATSSSPNKSNCASYNIFSNSPQKLSSQPVSTGFPEHDVSKGTLTSPKFSTYTLKKARSMLHSALGTVPMLNHQAQVQQANHQSLVQKANKILSAHIPMVGESTVTTPSSSDKVEEHGDILDILRTHQNEPGLKSPEKQTVSADKTSSEKRKFGHGENQIAKKSTTKKPNIPIKDVTKGPLIKCEPADGYSGYGGSEPANENPPEPTPSVVMENVQGSPVLSPANQSSHSLLSNQVKQTLVSQQPSVLPMPSSLVSSSQQLSLAQSLYAQSKPVPPVTAPTYSLVPMRMQPPSRFTAPSLLQSSPATTTTTSSSSGKNSFVPVMAELGPGQGPHRVTIRLANNSVTPTPPVAITRMPVQLQGTRTIPPRAPGVIPHTAPAPRVHMASTPALLQTNAIVKTIIPPPMPVASINIDTVGLPRITELIARKNPIPNYKAPPVPDNMKKVVGGDRNFLCYECGDSFSIQSSLNQHRGRYSMKITYKCDECNKEKCFFNKCQFLGHLRQHLNIDKTQAVPIHIKSDSISIIPLPKVYFPLIFQVDTPKISTAAMPESSRTEVVVVKKVKKNVSIVPALAKPPEPAGGAPTPAGGGPTSAKGAPASSLAERAPAPAGGRKRCRECGIQVSVVDLPFHFKSTSDTCDFVNTCGICHMVLPSICALRAHRRIHSDPDASTCPECGEHFFKEYITSRVGPLDSKSAFIRHMRFDCCHANRIVQMTCPKCEVLLESSNQIKTHLLASLDQYFKCHTCPMAFRTMAGFERHFETHSKGKLQRKDYKHIFKCHLCECVLDDLAVVDMHINGHQTELRGSATYGWRCTDCCQVFPWKDDLVKHIKEKHDINFDKTVCSKCVKAFGSIVECFVHDLLFHRTANFTEYKSCKMCGSVMDNETFLSHPCNKKKKTKSKYVCNFCNCEIVNMKSLAKHMEIHKQSGTPVCSRCFRTDFQDMATLAEHQISCCLPQRFQIDCMDCKMKFSTSEQLDWHRKEKHPTLFPCHLCGDTYQSQTDLKNHVKVKHVGKRDMYPCHICHSRGIKKAFSNKVILEKHLIGRHRGHGRTNPVIAQKFLKQEDEESSGDYTDQDKDENKDSLKHKMEEMDVEHQPIKKLRVEGETRFTCAKCSLTCEDRATFLVHLVEHRVDAFIQCMECGLSFAVMPSLRKHLFMVHKVKDFETYCHDNGIDDSVVVDYDKEIQDIPPVPEMEVKPMIEIIGEEEDDMDDDTRDPLECRVCHRVLESEADLRTHQRTHGMAFIRNKRRNKMVPSAMTQPPEMNGNDTDEEESLVSVE